MYILSLQGEHTLYPKRCWSSQPPTAETNRAFVSAPSSTKSLKKTKGQEFFVICEVLTLRLYLSWDFWGKDLSG